MQEWIERAVAAINRIFVQGNYMALVFLFALIFAFFLFARLIHSGNKIELLDIFLGPDNKISITKTIQLGAFITSTWAFIYFAMQGKLSEGYFMTYMTAWAGSQLINKAIVNRTYIQEKKLNK